MEGLRARRWKTIHVIGCDSDGMRTVSVNGKGGVDGGLLLAKQPRRRLTLSSIDAQPATGPANWTFEPPRGRKRRPGPFLPPREPTFLTPGPPPGLVIVQPAASEVRAESPPTRVDVGVSPPPTTPMGA
jgi:hypothetical protein